MSGPTLARNQGGRRYVWPPNPPYELVVPSVTTITRNMDKPALPRWAAREAARYAVDNLLEWEALPASEAVDKIKAAPWDYAQKKMDLGTAVHAAIDAWHDDIPTVDPDLLPYVQGALSFLGEHVEKVRMTEATMFNTQYQYAGTADALVRLNDGRYAIVDWKSGKGIYPETALQLAAYARCEFIGKDDGTRINLDYDIPVGVAVHLRDDGSYTAYFCEVTDRLFGIFRALRNLQLWKDEMEGEVWKDQIKGTAKEATA